MLYYYTQRLYHIEKLRGRHDSRLQSYSLPLSTLYIPTDILYVERERERERQESREGRSFPIANALTLMIPRAPIHTLPLHSNVFAGIIPQS
jgi:hypothetical protein